MSELLRDEVKRLIQVALDYIEGCERVESVDREASEELRAQIGRVMPLVYA